MTVSGMAFDWNKAGGASPSPIFCDPIDTNRFEVAINEESIALVDHLGGEFQCSVNGVPIMRLTRRPNRPYSATIATRLPAGINELKIQTPGTCQSGLYVLAPKPLPTLTEPDIWLAEQTYGSGSGADRDNARDWKQMRWRDAGDGSLNGNFDYEANTRYKFRDGIYKRTDNRLAASLIRAEHVQIEAESPGGAIFDGSYPSSVWTNEGGGIWSTPMIDVESNYTQVVDLDIRIPYWRFLTDLQNLDPQYRSGWTKDATKVYVRLPQDRTPDASTILTRDFRAFQVESPASRVCFKDIRVQFYRERAIRATDTPFVSFDNCEFRFVHKTAVYLNDCPEPKIWNGTKFFDNMDQTAWHQMKSAQDPYFTPGALSTESSTSLLLQTSVGSSKPTRRGVIHADFTSGGDNVIIRDEGDFGVTLHEVKGRFERTYDNPVVDNRMACCNIYKDIHVDRGHDIFAEDSDGYGPLFFLQCYGSYGYQNPTSVDPEVNRLSEYAYKRKGNYHSTYFIQCTFEPFHKDPNTQSVQTSVSALDYCEVYNCINIGEKIQRHTTAANILADGNVNYVYDLEPFPYEYDGDNLASLAEWQAATTQDANSIDIDPQLDANGVPQVPLPDAVAHPLNTHNRRGCY